MVMGTVALIWMFDCFVGFYLTLPAGSGSFSRWKTAWQIKRGASSNRLIYDVHRASSLWLWLLLVVFTMTGFALDLPGYYARVMNSITHYEHLQEVLHRPPLAEPLVKPPLDWYRALDLGQRYLADHADAQGFTVGHPAALEYRRDLGAYFYLAHTSRDLRDGSTPTETDSPASAATVAIDARDGHLLGVQVPTGQHAGNTFTSWIIALHVTSIFGRPWQIAVSLFGVLLVVVTITGVLIWWRKWRSRRGTRVTARDTSKAAAVPPVALVPERPA